MNHESVLLQEVIDHFQLQERSCIVDATLGLGGHTKFLLSERNFKGRVVGIDQDASHLAFAKERLRDFGDRFIAVHNNFSQLKKIVEDNKIEFDGILFDLGVASPHFDKAERGFSLHEEGPLDMRMNDESSLTAFDVLKNNDFQELADILWNYGEESLSRPIARAIKGDMEEGKLKTTTDLAELIVRIYRSKHKRSTRHPATKVFQALRIAVNDELGVLQTALNDAIELLQTGGRIIVISYHSLEDRIVKQTFKKAEKPCICPPKQPICTCGRMPALRIINRKPIVPELEEQENNPRSRSAKMRIAEKL